MDLPRDLLTFGVNLITAHHAGRDFGLTVAWLTRVGDLDLIALVGSTSATAEAILASRKAVVHVLAEGQQPLGKRFGLSSSRDTDKFVGLAVTRDAQGLPVVPGCRRAMSCDLLEHRLYDGDHLLTLRVTALLQRQDGLLPLVMRSEEYQP